jgi:hypothetical protein
MEKSADTTRNIFPVSAADVFIGSFNDTGATKQS